MTTGGAGSNWAAEEVELIVADYFEMLRAELLDQEYVKAQHRVKLLPRLDGRTQPSVEYKYQNISEVLADLG